MDLPVFYEISLVIITAMLISFVVRLLKQPMIIGYILAGVVSGPLFLDVVHSNETIAIFAHFGVSLLLFIIGLGLNPRVVKEVGRAAVAAGCGQVLITTAGGWLILKGLGYTDLVAFYIALALSFSSTIIVLKILSDKKEQNRLWGKISIGFLLVQDIIAAIVLVAAAAATQDGWSSSQIAELAIAGLLLGGSLWLMATQVLPRFKNFIASNAEFLLLFSLAWGFGIAYLFLQAGFSLEVGALAAGIALANQPYATGMAVRLRTLRDFFIIMFFVNIGANVEIQGFWNLLPEAVLLSAFVLIGNPLIVMFIMRHLGFTRQTGFKAGLAVSQISEFSLILIGLVGPSLGVISGRVNNLVILVALITITVSSYLMIYSDQIYNRVGPWLKWFEPKYNRRTQPEKVPRLLLIGYKKGGDQFINAFHRIGRHYLVIDHNPQVVEQLEQSNIPHLAGDATDLDLLGEVTLDKVEMIVLTLSDYRSTELLIDYLSENCPKAIIICSTDTPEEAARLYDKGASYVMLPHYIGNQQVLKFITSKGISRQAFHRFRSQHLKFLSNLKTQADEIGDHHH